MVAHFRFASVTAIALDLHFGLRTSVRALLITLRAHH